MEPFISAIIPTYNRPSELEGCLRAFARMEYPPSLFEVIVVDDGGETALEPVIARYRNRFSLELLRQRNGGPGKARNHGASRASGVLLVFTDDDCTPTATWLSALARQYAEKPRHAIGGRTLNGLPENRYSAASHAIMESVYDYYNADRDCARFFASNNLAMPTELFKAIGGFNSDWPCVASEDRELCDRWLHHGLKMSYAPEAIVFHSHALDLRSFWRQHFDYGRGAFRFHQLRARRGWGRFAPDFRFYRHALRSLLGPSRGFGTLSIVLLWQLANTAGCCREWFRAWREPVGELDRTCN